MAPWNAPVILGVRAIALPLACGNTVVLKASEICPGTHRLIAECLRDAGLPPGVAQRHHQRAGRCACPDRNADRPSRRTPGQFHRLDAGRPHHRAGRGQISQAGVARTRRQGADDRARRRRYRCRRRCRGVRRLHEPGPDLHVDRAPRRRREGRRRLRDQARSESRIAGRRRSRARAMRRWDR